MIFPSDYRGIGISLEKRPEDPIYFATRYLISYEKETTIYEIRTSGDGFMRRAERVEPIARGDEILEYPEKVDTRNRRKLIDLACELCRGGVTTVIFIGPDEHITFVHDPDPLAVLEIEILDVIPPEPSWLVYVIEGLERCGIIGDLTVRFKKRILDLRRFDGEYVYFPCRASGLARSLDSDRVDVDLPQVVGCDVSREVFRAMYPDKEFKFLNTCPLINRELEPEGPFITRCCRSENRGPRRLKGHKGYVVHWGDGPPEIAEAVRCLVEELRLQ